MKDWVYILIHTVQKFDTSDKNTLYMLLLRNNKRGNTFLTNVCKTNKSADASNWKLQHNRN